MQAYIDYFVQWMNYSAQCVGLSVKAAGCSQFWIALLIFIEIILFLVVVLIVRYIRHEKHAWKSHQQRLDERTKLADSETMSKAMWKPDERH